MAQLDLNRKVLNIIRVILFFTNFENKPNLFKRLKNNRFCNQLLKK